MKTSTRLAISTAFLYLSLLSEIVAQVHIPFSRHSPGIVAEAQNRRSLGLDFFSAQKTYVVNATVGTPPQNLSYALTLSADESWVPDADYCTKRRCPYGYFTHNASSTFVRPGTGSFYASYVDGTYASGDRIRETIGFPGGLSVTNLTMGLAQRMSQYMGVMALGYNDSSSRVPNLPDRLLAENLINSTAYSIWVTDEKNSSTGNLLLGAVDKAAFTGTLKRVYTPRYHYTTISGYSYSRSTNTFDVYIQAFNVSRSAGTAAAPLIKNTTALPLVTIDPTFSVSVLPIDIASAIWALAGAKYDEDYRLATIPCSYRTNQTAELSIQLDSVGVNGGPIIKVPLADLVMPEDFWVNDDYDYDTEISTNYCLFGVQNTTVSAGGYGSSSSSSSSSSSYDDNDYTLGAGMLKRQYMVFDLANREVAMAPVKFISGPKSSDVVPFSMYGAKIPASNGTGSIARDCYVDEDCYRSRTSQGSSGDNDSGGLPGEYIGMIAGFSILAAAMLAVAIWGCVQCCRDNRKYGPGAAMAEKGALLPAAVPATSTTNTHAQPRGPETQPSASGNATTS